MPLTFDTYLKPLVLTALEGVLVFEEGSRNCTDATWEGVGGGERDLNVALTFDSNG